MDIIKPVRQPSGFIVLEKRFFDLNREYVLFATYEQNDSYRVSSHIQSIQLIDEKEDLFRVETATSDYLIRYSSENNYSLYQDLILKRIIKSVNESLDQIVVITDFDKTFHQHRFYRKELFRKKNKESILNTFYSLDCEYTEQGTLLQFIKHSDPEFLYTDDINVIESSNAQVTWSKLTIAEPRNLTSGVHYHLRKLLLELYPVKKYCLFNDFFIDFVDSDTLDYLYDNIMFTMYPELN